MSAKSARVKKSYLALPGKIESFLKKQEGPQESKLRYVRLTHEFDSRKNPKRSFVVACSQFENDMPKRIQELVVFLFGLGFKLGHNVYYGTGKNGFSRIYAPMAVFEQGYLSWSGGLEDSRPRIQVVLVDEDQL